MFQGSIQVLNTLQIGAPPKKEEYLPFAAIFLLMVEK